MMFDTQTKDALRLLGLSSEEIEALEVAQKGFLGVNVRVKSKEYSADEWKNMVVSLWKLLQGVYPHLEGSMKESVGHVLDQLGEVLGSEETTTATDTKWFDPSRMLKGV